MSLQAVYNNECPEAAERAMDKLDKFLASRYYSDKNKEEYYDLNRGYNSCMYDVYQKTHTKIASTADGIFGGCYFIQKEDLFAFYDLYCKVHKLSPGLPTFFTEYQGEIAPLSIDLDIKLNGKDEAYDAHVHRFSVCLAEYIMAFVRETNERMELYDEGHEKMRPESYEGTEIFYMRKPKVEVVDGGASKHGVHLMFDFTLTKAEQEAIRQKVLLDGIPRILEAVRRDDPSALRDEDFFGGKPNWSAIYDNSISCRSTPWQLMLSRKSVGSQAYEVRSVWRVNGDRVVATQKKIDVLRPSGLHFVSVRNTQRRYELFLNPTVVNELADRFGVPTAQKKRPWSGTQVCAASSGAPAEDQAKYLEYCECIDPVNFTEYGLWWKFTAASANIGIPFEVYDQVVRDYDGYDMDNNRREFEKKSTREDKLGWGYIYSLAYEGNPVQKMKLDRQSKVVMDVSDEDIADSDSKKGPEVDVNAVIDAVFNNSDEEDSDPEDSDPEDSDPEDSDPEDSDPEPEDPANQGPAQLPKVTAAVVRRGENDTAQVLIPHLKDTLKAIGPSLWYCFNPKKKIWWCDLKKPLAIVSTCIQNHLSDERAAYQVTYNRNLNKETAKKRRDKLTKRLCEFEKEYKKMHRMVGEAKFSNQVIAYLNEYLSEPDFIERLDINKYYAAFQNGMMDLRTMEFRYGLLPSDYVTKVIKFDWEEPSPEDIAHVRSVFTKVTNGRDDHFDYLFSAVGAAMLGYPALLQIFLYLRGQKAGNGKSALFEILELIMPCYCAKLDSDAFDKANRDLHKTIAKLRGLRIAWLNELSMEEKNTAILKSIADGTSVAYKEWDTENKDFISSGNKFVEAFDEEFVRYDPAVHTTRAIEDFTCPKQYLDEFFNNNRRIMQHHNFKDEVKKNRWNFTYKADGRYKHVKGMRGVWTGFCRAADYSEDEDT
eukprot:gene24664-29799_t